MRLFLDSNVWIASVLTPRTCRQLVRHCWSHHSVLVTEWILEEIEGVLKRKFKFSEELFKEPLWLIRRNSRLVGEEPLTSSVCDDPDDDHVLAGALGGDADCIISGDDDLLRLASFKGIPILTPSQFWKFEGRGGI